jgi:hypothetical protein
VLLILRDLYSIFFSINVNVTFFQFAS